MTATATCSAAAVTECFAHVDGLLHQLPVADGPPAAAAVAPAAPAAGVAAAAATEAAAHAAQAARRAAGLHDGMAASVGEG
eukprot:CAMPEP_0179048992 /NCGR_PEP_ID=MMETSP0796-20121207/19986_1 /TAXON_ID=73915 /ORGANISM="Pyrodinium bahamense, Strain pbaha01" /LENGTH=80 /DNA_ID=CAMNT_0020745461 /DNA_START=310 /DNA_END=549 /DNA_ORIENTATION=-